MDLKEHHDHYAHYKNGKIQHREAFFLLDNFPVADVFHQAIAGNNDLEHDQGNQGIAQQVNFIHQHHVAGIGQGIAVHLLQEHGGQQAANGQG